jgi:hypothetical protein
MSQPESDVEMVDGEPSLVDLLIDIARIGVRTVAVLIILVVLFAIIGWLTGFVKAYLDKTHHR